MATGIPARLTAAEGRRFALTVGAAFLLLGALLWWRDAGTAAAVVAGIGATLGVAGVVVPGSLTPVYRGWMGLAHLISRVTTPIFLGVVYFGVITPIGLLMRLFGRNPMRRTVAADSYFVTRPAGPARRGDLGRQF
jgi:hypothetical protein